MMAEPGRPDPQLDAGGDGGSDGGTSGGVDCAIEIDVVTLSIVRLTLSPEAIDLLEACAQVD